MYRTIHMILWYDTIYTIHILYHMIHECLWYANMIKNFLHTIRYVLYDTDNYVCMYVCVYIYMWREKIDS